MKGAHLSLIHIWSVFSFSIIPACPSYEKTLILLCFQKYRYLTSSFDGPGFVLADRLCFCCLIHIVILVLLLSDCQSVALQEVIGVLRLLQRRHQRRCRMHLHVCEMCIRDRVATNYVFGLAVRKVKEGVEQGRSMVECMGEIPYFSKLLTEMTGVGERSGSMEETLEIVGDYFSNEVDLRSQRLLSALEPIITIVLAIVAVILLLGVYLPMFGMYGAM